MNWSPFTEDQLVWLQENLSLEVSTEESYNGGQDGSGNMYTPYKSLKLMLNGETISEVTFI